jgi:hypothetical protein
VGPANLRASCASCNLTVDHTALDRWRSSSTRIILVVGPPDADLLGYVEAHKGKEDRVIDYRLVAGPWAAWPPTTRSRMPATP